MSKKNKIFWLMFLCILSSALFLLYLNIALLGERHHYQSLKIQEEKHSIQMEHDRALKQNTQLKQKIKIILNFLNEHQTPWSQLRINSSKILLFSANPLDLSANLFFKHHGVLLLT